MQGYVLECFSQSFGATETHPIIVTVEESDRNGELDFVKDILNSLFSWTIGPTNQGVKTMLADIILF
jgi:hypothetical protein